MTTAGIPTPSAAPRAILSLRLRPPPPPEFEAPAGEVVGGLADVGAALESFPAAGGSELTALGNSVTVVGFALEVLEGVEVVEGGVGVDVAFTMLTFCPRVLAHWNW